MTLSMRPAAGPYNGLATKIGFIKSCYKKSLLDPRVRRWAERAAGRGDRVTQAKNLYAALKEALVYTRDPVGVEFTKSPSRHLDDILNSGHAYGDCDDHACIAYAMLQSIGIPAKLRVTWHGGPMPQHIYALANPTAAQWVAFDTTNKAGFGAEPSYTRAMDF